MESRTFTTGRGMPRTPWSTDVARVLERPLPLAMCNKLHVVLKFHK